ncbi:MAG: Pr6Pr family membrane protein [Beijerinckiaceae bacterium]|nr:Pr6Pr family membrane protein [Beijerinckiaceae bacterium]
MPEIASGRIPAILPRTPAVRRSCGAFLAGLGWLALAVELYFNIEEAFAKDLSAAGNIIKYFSFFTIETNLLAALSLTILCARPRTEHFMTRPTVTTAIAVYSIITGAVYAVLLRQLWHPAGLQLAADIVLHDVIPFLYPLFWLIFLPRGGLRWIDPFWWLAFPILYFFYSMIRAAALGSYLYPFLDTSKLGLQQVLVNAALLLVIFLALGLALVAIDRSLSSWGRARSRLGRAAEL